MTVEMKVHKFSSTDITSPESVEILVRPDGRTIWVNVNEVCLLRISKIDRLSVKDERRVKS